MIEQDAEIEWLKAGVSCAVLLERLPPPWRLDPAESIRRSLKYRRGTGEILIVNHDGHGWWDPLSDRKGDIFTLVQHLDPGLSFGAARRMLRDFVGIVPSFPEAVCTRRTRASPIPIVQRWDRCQNLSRGSPAWLYLARQRGLPERILAAAHAADAIREGHRGSAWFAHRDGAGLLTGIEMRGPAWRNFSAGGGKTLFRLPGGPGRLTRVAVCESAIDALSLAAIESSRRDTLYAATAGGIGPATITALQEPLRNFAADPAGILIAATDADTAGRRCATRLAGMAAEAGVRFDAILPPDRLNDWNGACARRRRGQVAEYDAGLAAALHHGQQEASVARQAVQLGDDQHSPAGTAGSQRGGQLRPIGALAALHLAELRHHLAPSLSDVGGDRLALRLKAKAGSVLAIGRDPEIADKTGVGRGRSQSLGRVYHFGKRTFDRVIRSARLESRLRRSTYS